MDLIVRRAQLTDRPSGQHLDIGIDGGRIVAIEPNLAAEGATYDAAGRLVCGGLVETHIHLDKAHLLDRRPAQAGRNINPVPYTSAIKPEIRRRMFTRARSARCRNASFEARHIFEPKWRSIP